MKIRLHLFAVLLAAIGAVSSFHSLAQPKPLSIVSPAAPLPALSPLPNTGPLVLPKDPNKFTFFVAGDNRPKSETVQPTATIVSFFKNVAKYSPSLVMLAGDTIYGKNPGDGQVIQQEYAAFCQAAKGQVPVFNAPGNHEMDDQNDVPNAQMQQWYAQYMGAPFGAFDYGNSRFIAMNTEEIAPQGLSRAPRAPTGTGATLDPGYVSQPQFDALKADLDANKGKAHIFIFMHHPIKPAKREDGLDPICAKPLEDLFTHYKNISYVIAAHEHLYYNPQGKNGASPPPNWTANQPPVYLVSGGAGAPLANHAAPGLAIFHYLVFTVSGNDVTVTLKRL
jgi:hypothetical protein